MRPSATINPLCRKALPPRCLEMAGPTCSRRNGNLIRYGHDQAGLLGLLSGVIEIWRLFRAARPPGDADIHRVTPRSAPS